MKRLAILSALLLASFRLCAQNYDTIEIGSREPTFYYSDTVWYDQMIPKDGWWERGTDGYLRCRPEVARYCHVDDTVRKNCIILYRTKAKYRSGQAIKGRLYFDDEYSRAYCNYHNVPDLPEAVCYSLE